jgi:hypothetical protein
MMVVCGPGDLKIDEFGPPVLDQTSPQSLFKTALRRISLCPSPPVLIQTATCKYQLEAKSPSP